MEERSRREKLLDKRKAMMDARLAKVKQRRKMKDGVGFFPTDDKGSFDNEIYICI